ncbi:MAG TPA: WbuC family cupin fold metalloprotein [Nevskiaceae bacterium]|nr:WbuC family cupin fold metalloprotein [Nevskiaceae bacterium]
MTGIKTYTLADLDALAVQARAHPRRRANLNLHSGNEALVHRFVIALCRDSYIRPHRHTQPHKLEMATALQGELEWLFFDDGGAITRRVRVSPAGPVFGLEVPPGVWHGLIAHSGSASFLEVKQGPYDAATDKELAPWAPAEGAVEAGEYHQKLYT